ncbi:unnamed protein product [Medioppia subpectinata]|uniref:Uncharacterized protein n=1 Tax=Medioppia subpectinata TaxID=1979941 RepID=A0A7R9KQU4_9ACAR|nr:unnamed protein product [Medioppia subpectinata]CAG2107841.1 unnamed protein product [Medioppia subpectinata]
MIGHSLTSFLHPNDIELVQTQIQWAHQQVSKGSQTSDKISFQCRLREKNQPRSEVITYQMVQVSGHITNSDSSDDPKECTDIEGDDKLENKILFKGFIQIIPTNPMAELSIMDADLDEYVSRHSLDGTLLFADHSPQMATIQTTSVNNSINFINSGAKPPNGSFAGDSSVTISPTLDTSFYSPNTDNQCEDSPIGSQTERLTLNGLNYEELSNHSTNSLLSFSFPSNDSQCDFGLIEDQSFDDNIIDDPFLSSVGSNGRKRSGFVSRDALRLGPSVETEASIVNHKNPNSNHSVVFASKADAN